MNTDQLKSWQCDKMVKALFPGANCVVRLKRRMENLGFRRDDPLDQLVATAHDALQALRVE